MLRPAALLLLLPLLAPAASAQSTTQPTLDGYVSAIDSQTSFTVDEVRVAVSAKTQSGCAFGDGFGFQDPAPIALGDHLLIYGKLDRKTSTVEARHVCRQSWKQTRVSGEAVLERVDGDRMLVDGRELRVTPKSSIKGEAPRHGLSDALPGDWVHYSAVLEPDGRLLAEEVTIGPNTVSDLEKRIRAIKPHEFVAPDPATGHDGTVKFSRLIPKRHGLPADPAVLARLQRIGEGLVPNFQKKLASGDPARIDFSFYSIEGSGIEDCFFTPSGVIFVPVQVSRRLSNDDELASVLATCVASLIEKHALILLPREMGDLAAESAGLAAGLAVPGLGLGAVVGASAYEKHVVDRLREQGDRVALDLLESAGRPPHAAPRAYEIVLDSHGSPKPRTEPPAHVEYLYQALAERDRSRSAAGSGQVGTP